MFARRRLKIVQLMQIAVRNKNAVIARNVGQPDAFSLLRKEVQNVSFCFCLSFEFVFIAISIYFEALKNTLI